MAKVVLLKLVKYGNTENIDMVEYGRSGSKIDKIWVLKKYDKKHPEGCFHYLTDFICRNVYIRYFLSNFHAYTLRLPYYSSMEGDTGEICLVKWV